MTEPSAQMREDLLKQFSSADAHNPLADFKAGTIAAMQARRRAAGPQPARDERADGGAQGRGRQAPGRAREADEVAAEHARSTAKGRPYEEAVFDARRRDRPRARRRLRRGRRHAGRRRAQGRRARRRRRLRRAGRAPGSCSRPRTPTCRRTRRSRELDEAMAQRDADYAVWVVPVETSCCPAHAPQLREFNGDKLFVVFDPEDGTRLALEVAYALARARMLMAARRRRGARRRRAARPRSSARWRRWTTCAGSSRS